LVYFNMKKLIFWTIIAAMLFMFIAGCASNKPLAYLKADDIAYIEVCLMNGNFDMMRVDDPDGIKEIVDAAHKVTAVKYTPTESYAGMSVGFFVHMKSGEEISFDSGNPIMLINGEYYTSQYQPNEDLNQLGHNILKTGFADISWNIGEQPFADISPGSVTELLFMNTYGDGYTETNEHPPSLPPLICRSMSPRYPLGKRADGIVTV